MNTHSLKGIALVTKLILRQQRFKIIIWVLSIVSITLAVASSYSNFYNDAESKQAFAMTMKNPAMVAMLGPGYELEGYFTSLGTLFAEEMLLFSAIVVAILSILLVGNSTREDEESGRVEVIRSLPVGRLCYLTASIVMTVIVNGVIAVLTGIGLAALDMEGVDVESALLYGAILGITGILFGAITALFAQVFETSRETMGFSFGVLIVVYIVRAIGDVGNETLALFSPLGWIVRTNVFVENHWWPILVTAGLSIIVFGTAGYLNANRDLGAGFIATRKGRKHASLILKTTFGLIFSMQRTQFIGWSFCALLLGVSFGAVLGDLETYYADIEFMEAFIDASSNFSMTEQFIGLLLAIMALIFSIPTVFAVLKLKGEEHKNRTEHFYSRAVSRNRVLGSYLLVAVIESVVLQLLVGLGLWIAGMMTMEGSLSLVAIIRSALLYLPAIWLVVGLAVILVGIYPKISNALWLYVAFCFIVIYLGGLLELPEWLMNLSVFQHIQQYPADNLQWSTLMIILMISLSCTIIGFISYNKRDILG